jgi:hypothetical protein
VVSAITGVRRGLRRVADRLAPAEVALLERSAALVSTFVVGVVAELGVADLLVKRPRTAAELAVELRVDAGVLHRVLRVAAAMGVLRLDGKGRFRLGRLGRPLRSDHPGSVRSWARYLALRSTVLPWTDLLESVRTGRGAFPRVHGHSVWQHYAENPGEHELFNTAMRRFTEQEVPGIVGAYPWPERGTVCDVGGGLGAVLAGVLKARPGLRGLLVDSPAVLAEAEEYLAAAGVRDRVELKGGDLFGTLDARADLYVLKDVLHDWDDAACARILGGVRAAAPAGSRIVVIEGTLEHTETHPVLTVVDLIMLTQTDDGRQRSVGELHDLFRGAGFAPGGVYRTAGLVSLVEGR